MDQGFPGVICIKSSRSATDRVSFFQPITTWHNAVVIILPIRVYEVAVFIFVIPG